MYLPTLAPNAGPTGGDGLAFPAGKASLIMPVTAYTEIKASPKFI